MINPDFSAWYEGHSTDAERTKWCKMMVDDFTGRGSVEFRVSMNSWEPKACIVEGWLQHLEKDDLPPTPQHF